MSYSKYESVEQMVLRDRNPRNKAVFTLSSCLFSSSILSTISSSVYLHSCYPLPPLLSSPLLSPSSVMTESMSLCPGLWHALSPPLILRTPPSLHSLRKTSPLPLAPPKHTPAAAAVAAGGVESKEAEWTVRLIANDMYPEHCSRVTSSQPPLRSTSYLFLGVRKSTTRLR